METSFTCWEVLIRLTNNQSHLLTGCPLLQSCKPQSLEERLTLASRPKVWHQLVDTAVLFTLLHGQLLAVGGFDSNGKDTTAIHMYNTTANSWKVISHMTTPRWQCLVAVSPHNELMVVGIYTAGDKNNSVGITSVIS